MAPTADRELDLLISKLRKIQSAVGGPDEERALRKKKKSKEDDRFAAVKSAIIKRLGDTCDALEKLKETDDVITWMWKSP